MTCPTDEALAQMASGALHGAELEALEHHLDGCGNCRTLLAAVTHGSAPYAPPERALLKSGERLGRYEIEALIAAGGMGMLYAARDPQLNRRVVLKLMRPAYGADIGRVRLLREAQAMASLSHPNVVSVFELGESGERVFVAMELVEGGTLRDWMKAPGTWKDVLAMMAQAGQGLAAAHRAGVVHRDFKPENVLVGTDGRPRVGDFGLARPELVAQEEPPKNLPMKVTHTGTMLGTPAYMSPEQLAGKPADARSDQYSFCVTLYEALTGKRPFPSESLEQLRAHVAGGMPPPPKDGPVPAHVWAALAKGLQPRPEVRFPDIESLLEVLSSAAPVVPVRRKRVAAVAVAAALMLALAAGAVTLGVRAGLPMLHSTPAAPALPDVVELAEGQTQAFAVPGLRSVNASGVAIAGTSLADDTLSVTGGSPGQGTLEITVSDGRLITTAVQVEAPHGPMPMEIVLKPEETRALALPGITRAAIGETDVAQVEVGENTLQIEAGDPGTTSLVVWVGLQRYVSVVKVTGEPVPEGRSILLRVGVERVFDIDGIQRVAVGDPSIADVKTVGSDQILMTGGRSGTTTLDVLTVSGQHKSWIVNVEEWGSSEPERGLPAASIELNREQRRVWETSGVTRVAVMNGAVASVDYNADVLSLTGGQSGFTTLLVWTGKELHTSVIRVATPDEVVLKPKMKDRLDDVFFDGATIGDSAVATLKTLEDGHVEILGLRPGRTTLLFKKEDEPDSLRVTVVPHDDGIAPAVELCPTETWEVQLPGVKSCSSTNLTVAKATCVGGKLRIEAVGVGPAIVEVHLRDGTTHLIDVRGQFF
jgi:serine/threonine-protein kinase